jgi:hypothetical protein
MFQHVPAERVVRPQGGGGHHRLRPIPQGYVPHRHRRSLRQGSQCHENRLALDTGLRLRHPDIECAIDTDSCRRTSYKRGGEDGDGSRSVGPCRGCLFGQGGAHGVFFRRCPLWAAAVESASGWWRSSTGAIDTTGMVRKAGGSEGSLLARTPQTHAQELPPLFQGLLQTACFDTGVWDKTADDAVAAIDPVATQLV